MNENRKIDQTMLKRGVRLNSWMLAITLGLGAGFALFAATILSMITHGEHAGGYLNLLGVFLPGYSVSPVGAFIGFFWAALFAGASGSFIYSVYARSLGDDTARYVFYRRDAVSPPTRLTMRLSARSLGIAIGMLLAAQLILSTNWLVFRGTADESHHAALLAHYLPGYSVSFFGSVIGAAWLFLYAFVYGTIVAKLYNLIARRP